MKVVAVAANTAREAIRDRILYLLMFFALLMIGASKVLSMLSIGSEQKIIVDVGLGSMAFFSVLMSVFMGIGLVSREIERRTIYAVVSKPITREAFVLGKFLGLFFVIALNELVMAMFFGATLWMWGAPFTRGYLLAILLTLLEAAVMLASALFFSAVASPILATMFTLAAYFLGHWIDGLRLLAARMPEGPGRTLVEAGRRILPNLEHLNLRDTVVFPEPGMEAAILSTFWTGALYGTCYAVAILAAAAAAYRRKDFV